MLREKTISRLLMCATMLSGMAVILPSSVASAQETESDTVRDTITVTGSRLQTNPNLTSANPVLSVSEEEIDVRGNIRIEDFVNILPQVFAGQASEVSNGATGTSNLNLRGLGANRTLVLIDGHRLPYGSSQSSPANLDLIPSQLIDRVDILTGGASAVYGSDAVGGVANFILKSDFEGVSLEVTTGIAQNDNGVEPWDSVLEAADQPVPGVAWDGEEYSFNLTVGVNAPDDRGNVTLFASYQKQEPIRQNDRSVSGCALGQDDGPNSFEGFGCVGSGNFRLFGKSAATGGAGQPLPGSGWHDCALYRGAGADL